MPVQIIEAPMVRIAGRVDAEMRNPELRPDLVVGIVARPDLRPDVHRVRVLPCRRSLGSPAEAGVHRSAAPPCECWQGNAIAREAWSSGAIGPGLPHGSSPWAAGPRDDNNELRPLSEKSESADFDALARPGVRRGGRVV